MWAHQAAEKAVKSLLVLADVDPPRFHDLDRLAQRLPGPEAAVLGGLPLPVLTRWAVEGRYPLPEDEATPEDAREAISVAERVVAVAQERLSGGP